MYQYRQLELITVCWPRVHYYEKLKLTSIFVVLVPFEAIIAIIKLNNVSCLCSTTRCASILVSKILVHYISTNYRLALVLY